MRSTGRTPIIAQFTIMAQYIQPTGFSISSPSLVNNNFSAFPQDLTRHLNLNI